MNHYKMHGAKSNGLALEDFLCKEEAMEEQLVFFIHIMTVNPTDNIDDKQKIN